ncbi:tyrosine-type recombinase/integrase [Vibrio harveyi]|uniref:tyrosine-type recombinase/integrase n=1 Tax=Vibrio harveyi TaxID=669 RepID=UPI003D739116
MKKNDLPKLPKGLSWRKYTSGNVGIQISFTFKGISCREVIANLTNTKSDIAYASNLIGEIKAKIARETFKYADYFPNSKALSKFGEDKSNATLSDYIDHHIQTCVNKGSSEYTIIKKKAHKNRLHKKLETRIVDIDTKWLKELFIDSKLSLETNKITLGIIKGALDEAVIDNAIEFNPCVSFKIQNYVNKEQRVYNTSHEADPFTLEECIAILEGVQSMHNLFWELTDQIENFIQLWFNTGLRTQEIFALRWENVDFNKKSLSINKGIVKGKEKDTLKNKKAKRTLPLNDAALQALEEQRQHTFFKQGLIFIEEKNNFFKDHDKFCRRVWKKVLKVANVRYRRPYNCRHTFATMHISSHNQVNPWELIQWMGHSSLEMLQTRYADFKKTYEQIDSMKGISRKFNNEIARAKRV